MAKPPSKPKFIREESWRYRRVKESWRAPHGKTSRVRRSKKGWPAVVKIGYATANSRKGLHPSGLKEVRVWRPEDLGKVDPKINVVRIAHTVGENKRVRIVEEAKKANITVLNPGLKKPAEPEAAPEVTQETAPETKTEKETEQEADKASEKGEEEE